MKETVAQQTEEILKILTADTIPWDGKMMLYHPFLSTKPCGGFYSDPEEIVEALEHIECSPERKAYAFATTPEGCQSFTLEDLIESAAQDMHEDWYEAVTDQYSNEIVLCQAMLDKLQEQICASHPTWRVDYSRCVLLPVTTKPAVVAETGYPMRDTDW